MKFIYRVYDDHFDLVAKGDKFDVVVQSASKLEDLPTTGLNQEFEDKRSLKYLKDYDNSRQEFTAKTEPSRPKFAIICMSCGRSDHIIYYGDYDGQVTIECTHCGNEKYCDD